MAKSDEEYIAMGKEYETRLSDLEKREAEVKKREDALASESPPHAKGEKPPGSPSQDHSGTKPEATKPVVPKPEGSSTAVQGARASR